MGGACTQSYSQLDSSSGTVAGTEIPAWVAAAGKGLFQEAAAIAQKGYDVFPGEGNRVADLTDAERQGMNILSQGAENYLPYMNRAGEVANTLGQGYQGMSQEELLGDPFQGATRADLLGNYEGATREELLGDYQGATREELLGDPFSLESAQPYMDIYQSSMDPAVREIEEQTLRAQNEARARASTGGGGFAAGRYDTDRAARAATENTMRNQFEQDRAARFGAEDVSRGQFEQDRSARFGADSALRGQYDTDRQARFGADTQGRSTYETNEASRIQQMDAYQGMAPLVQDLQRQAAAGLIGAGEAERMLEQAGFDIAYANFLDQKAYPKEQVNFALGALSGTPYNTINRSYTTGSQMSANPSLFGQTLAGMGGLYSAYKMTQ